MLFLQKICRSKIQIPTFNIRRGKVLTFLKIFLSGLLLLLFFLLAISLPAHASVCENGLCESGEPDLCPLCYYEDPPSCDYFSCELGTCPEDCGDNNPLICGDGFCDARQDVMTCPADCGGCGDGICGYQEDMMSCPDDCEYGFPIDDPPGTPITAVCGDGIMERPFERCDDGNTEDGDGCNHRCQIEGVIISPTRPAVVVGMEALKTRPRVLAIAILHGVPKYVPMLAYPLKIAIAPPLQSGKGSTINGPRSVTIMICGIRLPGRRPTAAQRIVDSARSQDWPQRRI